MIELQKQQWESLINSIIDKRCILFLGPGITVNYNKKNSMEMIYKMISRESKDVAFHKTDNLLIFKDCDLEVSFRSTVKNYFSQDFSNELLNKLSDIPFHLIISVTPDHTLSNIFQSKSYLFNKSYFVKNQKKEIDSDINETPLIYNLFGDIEDETSIIFSHYDLFEYLEHGWMDSNCLPEAIKKRFNKEKTSNIIFIGFEFDKWYYQFILYLFKLNYPGCIRYAAYEQSFPNEMLFFCQSYKITFIDKGMDSFVRKLHNDFPSDKLRIPVPESYRPRKWRKGSFISFLTEAFGSALKVSLPCLAFRSAISSSPGS